MVFSCLTKFSKSLIAIIKLLQNVGDEKGHLILWNHQKKKVYEHVPLAGQISCICCSPDEDGVVVVGWVHYVFQDV